MNTREISVWWSKLDQNQKDKIAIECKSQEHHYLNEYRNNLLRTLKKRPGYTSNDTQSRAMSLIYYRVWSEYYHNALPLNLDVISVLMSYL
jgi:hypothetical protein